MFFKRSHQRYSVKKGVLKNFSIFTGKHLCWSLFKKISYQKETPTQDFTVTLAKFLRTAFFTEHLGWLLLLFRK